jgi:hypothetical protein
MANGFTVVVGSGVGAAVLDRVARGQHQDRMRFGVGAIGKQRGRRRPAPEIEDRGVVDVSARLRAHRPRRTTSATNPARASRS